MEVPEYLEYFVDDVYLSMLDEEGVDKAVKCSSKGYSARTCVGLGIYYSSNNEWSWESIEEELEVSRRAIYDARSELGLTVEEG